MSIDGIGNLKATIDVENLNGFERLRRELERMGQQGRELAEMYQRSLEVDILRGAPAPTEPLPYPPHDSRYWRGMDYGAPAGDRTVVMQRTDVPMPFDQYVALYRRALNEAPDEIYAPPETPPVAVAPPAPKVASAEMAPPGERRIVIED